MKIVFTPHALNRKWSFMYSKKMKLKSLPLSILQKSPSIYKNKPKIHYDPEVKILRVQLLESKSVDSDIKGNVILDYDKDGNLVNIDIMEINFDDIAHD